jgi:hypothetical protein
MNKAMFSPHLLLFLPCSFLFPLFSFILEYLRAAVRLGWICFLSFHLCFSEFLFSYHFSKKSSKIKFLEKFQKNLFKFLCQKWGREAPGRPQGDLPCHLTTKGRGPSLAAPTYGEGAPLDLSLHPHFLLSPKISQHPSSNPCSCCSPSWFLISLLSPSLLLWFGAFILRYVTPSIVQIEFCLVEYFLSILAL